ncbi:hypothetical protein PO909_011738 [Leuciscus waleckii]
MRSSSYVKAMGDQDSGDSDGSPKNSPQKSVRPDALVKSVLQRQLSDQSSYRLDKSSRDMVKYLTNITADLSQSYHLQTSREIHPSITLEPSPNYNSPKFRSRNQSYMRAVSTLSQASCVSQVSQVSETEVNGQFESVCESVFSEVESQAMDALDLPGCFRTRSHSYLRAIQAGFSQDDDCVPSMTSSTVTSTIRSTTVDSWLTDREGVKNNDGDTRCITSNIGFLTKGISLKTLNFELNLTKSIIVPVEDNDSPSKDLVSSGFSSLFCALRDEYANNVWKGNDVLEGTGLLNEDNLLSEGPDLTSMACGDTGFRGRGDESSTLYGNSSPTTSPSLPPLKTSAPIRPRPVQSSVQETADLALAISQQWRDDVSAMRKELADLRKDLCTELRAFNMNFSTFTQHYSTWSPSWVRETQTAAPQVSVSTQAGSKTLVRQNTADAAVNCPSPVDPDVFSMSPSEPADKNVLHISASSPFFQTDPNSELAEIDDPTFANLTPPDPVDVASLCWPDIDSDSMTPPDPPEPVPEVEPYCFTKSSTPEHVESIVLDFTNVELVNLASLQWPKLDPDDIGSPPQESLDRPSQQSPEQPAPYTMDLGSTSTQEQSVLESMQPLLLSHTDEEPMDFTSLELDSVVLSPMTPDSMNLHDLKWPSLESLELNVSGSQSPGPVDLALPNPPTPETVYEYSCESTEQEPPFPELLDTIYLQPATPEPESRTESDISNPTSPEPHFPTWQKPAAHELDTQALVLWSKKETFMVFAEEGSAINIPESCSEEEEGQNVDSPYPMIHFPIHPDTVESAHLESETLYSAVLCSVESDTFDPEVTSMDEPMSHELNPPGLATIDPATVHPFNLSLLELQSALDVSKSETSDNGSPKGTAAISSPSHSLSGIQFHLPSSGSVDRPSQQPPAVTYTPSTPTYKRTPPPVPPRSTSKPLISITAQSSTESTQDAYHEGQLARGGLWGSDGLSLSLGRALYNSTDSLDSAKAVTIAMEAAAMAMAGKRHPSTDSHSSVMTCDKAVLVSRAEEYLKTPRSSIGIQVEAATDSECESKGSREYQSVGIQVEDERRQGRFKRSNSVTAAVQADLELEGFPLMEDKGLQFGGGFQRHSEPSTPTQYGAVRTVRTQGLFSYREDYRTPTEPPSPQRSPEPWLEPSPREPVATVAVTVTPPQPSDSGRASPSCRRDGSWFMQLLHTETKKMEGWCKELEGEAEENDMSEEILGKIRSAVGSAQLLMSQKFQQFYWLCQQNLDPSAMPRPTSQDLAGFWDLLQLSIDDVTSKFNELQKIKSNDWRLIESPVKKLPPPVPKKTLRKSVTREKSLDIPDRQRLEARRRLMAAKRAASFRQNSASERADSIEIYIPEAQTRL